MILPDVNVLLYAFRSDAENHAGFRAWLAALVNGDAAYGMSLQVPGSLVRLATHPRIFARPSRLAEALRFSITLLEQPYCQPVQPGPRHWRIFCDLCRDAQPAGNLVPDAWFAALAIESGCEWVTTDRDYARFRGLRWRTPFCSRRERQVQAPAGYRGLRFAASAASFSSLLTSSSSSFAF